MLNGYALLNYYFIIIFVFLEMTASSKAFANDSALQDAIAAEIQSDRADGCEVSVETATLGVSRRLKLQADSLKVVSIQTEGCQGGNNYQNRVVVFDVSGSTAVRVLMRELYFPWVESIKVSSKSGVPIVVIIAPKYLEDDARCCPSMLQEVRVWAERYGVEWKEIKVWQKN